MIRRAPALFLFAGLAVPLLASCAAAPRPVAAPSASPPLWHPAPVAAPPPVTDRFAGDWSIADLSAGEWYLRREARGTSAVFSTQGSDIVIALRCDDRSLVISRAVSSAIRDDGTLTIHTSFADRTLSARVTSGAHPMLVAIVPASDTLFDQMIYSRGRFLVEATREPPLIVPTRPEIARVVEDCRG